MRPEGGRRPSAVAHAQLAVLGREWGWWVAPCASVGYRSGSGRPQRLFRTHKINLSESFHLPPAAVAAWEGSCDIPAGGPERGPVGACRLRWRRWLAVVVLKGQFFSREKKIERGSY